MARERERTAATGPDPALGRWVTPLIAVSVFVNYVDRGNLGTAAPLMKDALRLTNTELGLLLSAFYWTYTPGQLAWGWLAQRLNPYRALALGLAIWSLATVATGLAAGFSMLLALRLAVGLGESASFPCSARLFAAHLPANRLGRANGLVSLGLGLGPAIGTFFGGLLMARTGWRPSFLVFGLLSLLWLAPWLIVTRGASRAAAAEPRAGPRLLQIVRQRAAWGAALGHFSANYGFYFVAGWLPTYLVKAQHFSLVRMAELGGLIYVIYGASALGAGWLADRWMRRGASDTLVRKTMLTVSHAGVAVALAACAFGGREASIVSLIAAAALFGLGASHIFATGQTLGGRTGGGQWMGFQNSLGNLAGILGPLITGVVVDRTGGFAAAFLIAGAVSLLGVLGWGLIVPRIGPIAWDGPEAV